METLAALFAYRNKMFHNGFEWPMKERHKFSEEIQRRGWPPEWFKKSTSGDQPWIFYMSADFIQHCLDTIDQVWREWAPTSHSRIKADLVQVPGGQ